jgi:DNA transformation protein and related proteins
MTCAIVIVALSLVAVGLDRFLVWCELRGWIYYRLSPRPVRSAIGSTLLGIEALYRPSRRHVIELQQESAVHREDDDEGGRGGPGSETARDTITPLMAVSDGYLAFTLDQLAPLGAVTPRRMFGGVGLYHEDVFFGILAGDSLYLKVDDHNRGEYEAAGMTPFQPFPDRPSAMQYYCVPMHVLEDSSTLTAWAGRAVHAAQRQVAAKHRRSRTGTTGARKTRTRKQRIAKTRT